MNSDSNAGYLVLFVPELSHLFVQALELLCELFCADHCSVLISILPILALTHSDGLINCLALASQVVSNVLSIRQRFEHGKDFELLALPRFKV